MEEALSVIEILNKLIAFGRQNLYHEYNSVILLVINDAKHAYIKQAVQKFPSASIIEDCVDLDSLQRCRLIRHLIWLWRFDFEVDWLKWMPGTQRPASIPHNHEWQCYPWRPPNGVPFQCARRVFMGPLPPIISWFKPRISLPFRGISVKLLTSYVAIESLLYMLVALWLLFSWNLCVLRRAVH